jgi:signal transduction histidine kinase
MKLSDLKLGVKQAMGFGLILAIMAGVNIFAIRKMAAIKTDIDEVTANRLPRAVAISDINLNTAALRTNQLQYAFTTDPNVQNQQKELMIHLIDKINENIDVYERLKTMSEAGGAYSAEESRLYAAFTQNWEQYQDLTIAFIGLLRTNQIQEAVRLLNSEAQVVFNELSLYLTRLVEVNKKDSYAAARRAEITFRSTRKIATTLLILTILLSAFLAAGLSRLIAIPVRHLVRAAQSVAEGNLNVRVNTVSKDEIGYLAKSFNQMTTALRETREKLHDHQRRLQAQNQELEEKSQSLAQRNTEIERKNHDLENALAKLKRTQLQLVQSERMASLGQLTAGIAHEINNPVNFVSSNINPLRRDVADLLAILAKYEEHIGAQHLQEKFQAVDALKKDLDFSYMQQEIENLLNGIQEGARRTSEIVRSLRNFTRLGEDERKPADINKGLESTLLMLQHQLKKRVEVIKDFGVLPEIMCYPGKLNQVFMNILVNASQAIVGSGKIFIKTSYDGEIVTISIKDTGVGMSNEIKQHIFEPFFTTKGVGEGTGLGLPITYGIIEEHDGNIEVYSEPGKGSEFVITLPAK